MTGFVSGSTNEAVLSSAGERDSQVPVEDEKSSKEEHSALGKGDDLEKANTKSIEERSKDLIHNRGLREKYANRVFLYLVCYSIFVGGLLLLSGFGCWGFSLGTGVLMVLVGSTAVSAIGLVYTVVSGLFAGLGKR